MNKEYQLNPIQATITLLQAMYTYIVAGRGLGKSTMFGNKMHDIVTHLPGASGIIAAKTYTHVLTSILPSAFAHLERMGYIRDIHYVIGRKPPQQWGLPYQPPVKNFDNYITFFNKQRPTGFFLTSQEKEGSGRGPNTDFLLTDETLRLDKKKLDNEIAPTLRANKDKFKHISWHLGEFHSTSMPYTEESRWILEKGQYYLQDYGTDIFALWAQVIDMQIELLDITDPKEFQFQWNEINRLRKRMQPRLSADGKTLFILSNAFDNWQNVGLSYIREQKQRLPWLIFLIEIMNAILTLTENPYYNLAPHHSVHNAYDDHKVEQYALNNNFDFKKLSERKALMLNQKYYNPNEPIYLFFDWGGTVSFVLAAQLNKRDNTLNILKEEYVLPPDEMPKTLMKRIDSYFEGHKNKIVYYVKDTFGDSSATSIVGQKTINEESILQLKHLKWNVIARTHAFKEPPQLEKWKMMQLLLKESPEAPFKIRINAYECKYLLISMQDAKVRQVNEKIEKDKTSERRRGQDQRTSTHASDAIDKGCYYIYKNMTKGIFIDATI